MNIMKPLDEEYEHENNMLYMQSQNQRLQRGINQNLEEELRQNTILSYRGLVQNFYKLDIPSFWIKLCQLLIESNTAYLRENKISRMIKDPEDERYKRKLQKVMDEHILAIDLLIELWVHFPDLFVQPQKQKLLWQ